MRRRHPTTATSLLSTLTLCAFALMSAPLPCQVHTHEVLGRASYVIIPQSRAFRLRGHAQPIRIESVTARVRILDRTASTTLEVALHNPGRQQQEAVLLLPVPDGAAVSGFDFHGTGAEPSARLLPREEARRIYDAIVRKLKDPALLEFAGARLVRSSIFPIPAGGQQKVRLTYDQVLPANGNRVDYTLPRSESLKQHAPWSITVDVKAKSPISMVYSPSHDLVKKRVSPRHLRITLNPSSKLDPSSFLLSYLTERGAGVAASLFAYPDPKIGGGYFLLIAGLPATIDPGTTGLKREVTIVLDRSGSMAGKKMDQAKVAALQVIEGLADGEGFNIIDYSTTVASFGAAPRIKNKETIDAARKYLDGLRSIGGTNIHDALVEALRQKPLKGFLPIVLFLTDGLPTVGQTAETQIRAVVEKGNPHGRRIFTFGVGHDVNVPLLDRIAEITRATTTYVQPSEDVEVKVGQVFRKLYGPVLSQAKLETREETGEIDTRRVRELHPSQIPDLFENDQLVVLGQYRGQDPLTFRLGGNFLGKERTFKFRFELSSATTKNAFVPRLWASRRIAYLVDQIRQAGASTFPQVGSTPLSANPRLKELRDEIMRLSAEFGVLSEYTSFLATDGTNLANWSGLVDLCGRELVGKAIRTRAGKAAVNQGLNILYGKNQFRLNVRNGYWDSNLQRVEISTVQQIAGRAYFKRGKRWIDGRNIIQGKLVPDETIRFGSDAHRALLEKLVRRGRQASLSLHGEILMQIDGKTILVTNDGN